ncbi:MAG TPA: NAD(P)H-binding protein [Gaiellaceae bacterium]
MKILVTGGTGHLGRAIVAGLKQDGHQVRVLTRRPGDDLAVEWLQGDLATGEGITSAVAGVETVIHAATNSPAAQRGRLRPFDFVRSPTDVDIDGTRALLAAAEEAAVQHFIHVSIVGLRLSARLSPYSRVKIAAEELVRSSAVPWSIVRAPAFYWLLERMLANMTRRPIVLLPTDVRMQAVDSHDFAEFVVGCVTDGRRGEREDFVGPEVLTMRELAEQYLAARGLRRRIWKAPLPRRVKSALEAGSTSPAARRGATTWAEWLRRSGAAPPARISLAT